MRPARLLPSLAVALAAGLASAPAGASDLAAPGHGYGHGAAPVPQNCYAAGPHEYVAPLPVPLAIGPGPDYPPLAVVPACTRLNVILCEYWTGWCKVRYGRFDGWVFDPPRRVIHRYPFGH